MNETGDHTQDRGAVQRAQRRLDDLKTRGVEALSPYDIKIAYQGNAEQALRTATWLTGNHSQPGGERS